MNYLDDKEAGIFRAKVLGPFRLAVAVLRNKLKQDAHNRRAQSALYVLKKEFGISADKIKHQPGGNFSGYLENKALDETEKANKYARAAERIKKLTNKKTQTRDTAKQLWQTPSTSYA